MYMETSTRGPQNQEKAKVFTYKNNVFFARGNHGMFLMVCGATGNTYNAPQRPETSPMPIPRPQGRHGGPRLSLFLSLSLHGSLPAASLTE